MGFTDQKLLTKRLLDLSKKTKIECIFKRNDPTVYITELKSVYPNSSRVEVYIDFLVDITSRLAVETNKGNVQGVNVAYELWQKIEKYSTVADLIFLGLDGPGTHRPKPKDVTRPYPVLQIDDNATVTAIDSIVSAGDILINDNHFPTCDQWLKFKGNNLFRRRIYAYLTSKFVEWWSTLMFGQSKKTLVIYNGVIGSNLKYDQICINNGKVTKQPVSFKVCEGEQTIFSTIKNSIGTMNEERIVIADSIDSDFLAYAMNFRNVNGVHLNVILKNCQKKGKKLYQFLAYDIDKIDKVLDVYYDDISYEVSKADKLLHFIYVEMLRGTDFSPTLGSYLGLPDKHTPDPDSKKKNERLKRISFHTQKLIDAVFNKVERDHIPLVENIGNGTYVVNQKEMLKCLIQSKGSKYKKKFTKMQKQKMMATIKNCEWVLNYMLNPGVRKWVDNFDQKMLNGESRYGYRVVSGRCHQCIDVERKYFGNENVKKI